MRLLKGKGVCAGITFGRISFYNRDSQQVVRKPIDDVDSEIGRYKKATADAIDQISALYDKAVGEVGEQGALLFEIHKLMLEDEDYRDSILNIICQQKVNAEYAVAVTGDNFSKMFAEMDDPYMKERAADVKDISERLINALLGKDSARVVGEEPVIIAADDLAPSETIQMDKSKILSFITAEGAANSHTAILARTMGIPAVIGLGKELYDKVDGENAIVDGSEGIVYLSPDEDTITEMKQRLAIENEKKQLLEQLKGKANITKDGKEVLVYANIGSLSDLGNVLQNDAGGIGLFRSEFIYLESHDYPSETEQLKVYKTVVETMAGKRVIFRTLDIGADKQAAYFDLPKEENPAMGLRAIRICLTRPEIFKTQLRALYRASAYGRVAIMFPMITSILEVRRIKEIIREVQTALTADGIAFSDNVELGIMIETPAAALISDLLAKEVDFFSIGTNDLTQYTLAIDRQNPSIEPFCDTHHESILRMIQMVTDNAHHAGIWAGICGELASDLSLTETFIKMGVDELSVSPPQILPLRAKVINT